MPLEFNLCPANMVQKNPIMEAQTPTIAPALLTNTSTATPTPAVGIAHAVAVANANADAAGAEISMTSEVQTMLTRTEDVPAPLPLPNQAITINPTANGDGNGNIDSNANIDLNQGGSNANENDTSVAVAMTNNNMQSSNNANQKVIKARKSFSLKEKVGYVMAFQEDCHSGKPEEKVEEEMKVAPPSENAGAGAVAVDGTKESTTASAKKSKTRKKKTKAKVKPQPTASMHGFKTKKLKAWLKAKNEKDGTNIAYPTMYKWVQKYAQESDISGGGGMENSSSSHSNSKKRNSSALQEEWQSSIGHLKKIRSRPFQELESVLVEFLRVRNDSLRKKGMPVSNVAFIKDRANMFYKDMYNVEVEIFDIATKGTFKCSTGWVQRFRDRYKHILEPEGAETNTTNVTDNLVVHQQQHQQQLALPYGHTIMMENVPPVTEEDILQDNLRAHVMHVVPHPSHNPIAHQKLQLLGGPHAPVTL